MEENFDFNPKTKNLDKKTIAKTIERIKEEDLHGYKFEDDQLTCSYGCKLRFAGVEKVVRLDHIPKKWVKRVKSQYKYSCNNCDYELRNQMRITPKPKMLFQVSL